MLHIHRTAAGYELRHDHEVIRIDPWGPDSVRVRIARHRIEEVDHGALQPTAPQGCRLDLISKQNDCVELRNHALTVRIRIDPGSGNPRPLISFLRDGTEILTELPEHFWWPGAHGIYPLGSTHEVRQAFASTSSEKIYGLGQYSHGRLDQKGLVLDLTQRNGEVSIPFILSSHGYGFLWNNPAVGRVELSEDRTRWVGYGTEQIDYWFTTAPLPATILSRYADAVGHAPALPHWATGFWQSKLRYRTQEELLEVARRYSDEGIPLSVIVSDFIHWPAMGDYRFDTEEFPDAGAMIEELASMGTRLMVSIWPTVSPLSENASEMRDRGYLVATENGLDYHQSFKDKAMDVALPVSFYDATNPAARAYLWEKVRENYYDLGVRTWWLDACEPELNPGHPGNLSYFAGTGLQLSNIYPRDHARGFYEGMRSAGETDIVLLCRSAWAGQAKYGAAVWSGDIAPTWEALRQQVTAGQNIGISGIPWWTSDIGGFHGGDPDDPKYRELFIRWFQFGAFCPLFRLHGHREPREAIGAVSSGGPNEIWSYGPDAFKIARRYIELRERIRPYLHDVMAQSSRSGIPAMRPLFLDFPGDRRAWSTPHQYLLGPDLLVCPVTEPDAQTWTVYLPDGSSWREPRSGRLLDGGQEVVLDAPIENMPILIREGSPLQLS